MNQLVFLVEDNFDNIVLTELGVHEANCDFNSRASGRYLLQWVDENPGHAPDLILLDIQLPREDGYAVLKQIREHPLLRNTRVVAVTADVNQFERCRVAGFDGFIGKPLKPQLFPRQIQRILEGESIWERGI
jgi:two-component system, cell cycle response regulator DivK